jgi:hypothetical protein
MQQVCEIVQHDEGHKSENYQTTPLHQENRNISDPEQMVRSEGIMGKDALIEEQRQQHMWTAQWPVHVMRVSRFLNLSATVLLPVTILSH